jgi:hypothetical protein
MRTDFTSIEAHRIVTAGAKRWFSRAWRSRRQSRRSVGSLRSHQKSAYNVGISSYFISLPLLFTIVVIGAVSAARVCHTDGRLTSHAVGDGVISAYAAELLTSL